MTHPNKPRTGRCVIVTGADSGIGKACALAFAAAGDRVAVLYHHDPGETAALIQAAGGEAISVQASIDESSSVDTAFTAIEAAFGPACVLVNSAGLNMSGVKVRDMPDATWNRLIATDLSGAFFTSRRFLASCPGPGAITNISSIHAEAVRAGGADYCSAKGGLTNLVRTLAVEEAANGIRVNAIEPGMILTPMNERALTDAAYRAWLEQNIPMQRAGRPEEVAKLAVWLASDEASYITGAAIVIDGGLSLLQGLGA
ncbi:MAG: SDR family oxidoreductase [Asticcacaulis sp.]